MRHICVSILAAAASFAADPALTVYNQQFAIVRETIPLKLQAGANRIEFAGVTASVEPESVILRDPAGKRALSILEQNYRADPIALEALLAAYEGKTIEFQVRSADRTEIVQGKIIRAGSMPRTMYDPAAYSMRQQMAMPSPPIIEVAGKLRFELPGTPLFPALSAGAQLKPALTWIIHTGTAGPLDAELSYASGGFNWEADYNIVQGAAGTIDLTGWVTIENRSGKAFENAAVKLMAGDVNKVAPRGGVGGGVVGGLVSSAGMAGQVAPVTEKTFDEYHLYTLPRPVTLLDKESKQVEFLRAQGIKAEVLYVYDGANIDWNRYRHAPAEMLRQDTGFGAQSQSKVWVMREFINTTANRLGMALPKGKARFYRRDTDGRMEFTGEDTIDHTPENERIRVFTGAAFDIVGERRRTSFRIDHGRQSADESFEIKVRNRKKEPAEVRVVEHMYRWTGWEIPVSSMPPNKTDAQTAEFRVSLQPGEEKTVTYAVHYQW
ncbi:MAG TPA: DUF4139 domain-containing protein [Bryobacteraceae bacterium]|nr:DUF4139 domain-containing protein [Bryobacteraceae bacterium]